jgi:hypothetical protein
VVGPAALLMGLVLGAGILGAGAQGDGVDDGPARPDRAERREAVEAFVACAENAGIELPTRAELRRARQGVEPLSDADRDALRQAREACGDLLPGAEARQAVRTCLTEAGVLPEDGSRPDRASMTEEERAAFREALRTCAAEAGVEWHRRCGPGIRGDR